MKLRYLIAKDSDQGEAGAQTVIGYDATTVPINGIKYCNLLDEKNTGSYGPHIHSDTGDEYNEPAPDPEGKGFWDNLRTQLDRAKAQSFTSIELDNLDTYTASVALLCFNEAQLHGFTVWAKNPAIVSGNREAILAHSAIAGVIVEKDCGSPTTYDAMRKAVGKPGLPIRFVSFGDGKNWAQQVAHQITAAGYADMGVTFSADGEYGSSEDVLLPTKSAESPMAWRTAKSLLTLRDQVDAKYPGRDKSSDGTIGDASHAATTSDHNPDSNGVVHAMDISHDPAHGFDSYHFADILRQNRDPRIRYVISNRRIMGDENYGSRNGVNAWTWGGYNGSNPHDQHVHISVNYDARADDTRAWVISEDGPVKPSQPSPSPDVAVKSGKGSWYSQYRGKYKWVDNGDQPNSNALGVPDEAQGIAFYDQSTKGKWFAVTAPNGITSIEQQTDIGPSPSTGRLIDISASAAERFGYSPNSFPTDGVFHWYAVPVPSSVVGLTPQQQAVRFYQSRGLVTPLPPIQVPTPVHNDPNKTPLQNAIDDVQSSLDDVQTKLNVLKEQAKVTTQTEQVDWGKILQPIMAELAPKVLPIVLPYLVQYLPQLLPVILGAMFKQSAAKPAGMSAAQVGTVAAAGGGAGIIGTLLTMFLQRGGQ